MVIIYSDEHIIIAKKEAGMLSEAGEIGENTLPRAIAKELSIPLPQPVHRLDKEVGGALLIARTSKDMAIYSAFAQSGRIEKTYLAVCRGVPLAAEGEYSDLLYYDRSKNKVFVVNKERRGIKKAILAYRVIETVEYVGETYSLVEVKPKTGRTHQIRIQFASRGLPLFNDRKYGYKPSTNIANSSEFGLYCYSLSFPTVNGDKTVTVDSTPPNCLPYSLFSHLKK